MKSVMLCAERLFGGLEEKLQISVAPGDRTEIFSVSLDQCLFRSGAGALNAKQWIQKSLTADKIIENIQSPNHSFTRKDFMRTVSSLWQTDHHRFMPGLLKVTILLALQLYLFTGARIRAFILAHEDKKQRGLRYKVSQYRLYGYYLRLILVTGYRSCSVPVFQGTLEGSLESKSKVA